MENNYKPLAGITVVELATFVAAPYATRAMADWGANVIKIEPPKGDPMRMMGGLLNMHCPEFEASGRHGDAAPPAGNRRRLCDQ